MPLINPDNIGAKIANGEISSSVTMKTPKRILHFSDGVLEEYSTDEENNTPNEDNQTVIDPATLTWGPWFWYKTWRAGAGTLSVLDTMGEFLASFFGITTPKYYFELEEYRRKEAEKKKAKEEQKGWSQPRDEGINLGEIRTSQPKPVDV